MKLGRVRILPFRLPLRRSVARAGNRLEQRDGLLVGLESSAGVWGFGEATPTPGFPTGDLPEARATLTEAAKLLLGCDLQSARASLRDLARGGPASRAGLAALDVALDDLGARACGKPLCAVLASRLGTTPHREVPVNALLTALDPAAAARQARRAVGLGFRTLKVKIDGQSLERDLTRLSAVRAAVGSGVRLRIDANGTLEENQATEACRLLARFDLEYLEQPVPAAEIDALVRVRSRATIPIAADEAAATPETAERVIAARAADLLVIKPSVCGGLESAVSMARAARRAGIGVVVTSALDGAFGLAAALHFAAALGRPLAACGLATGALLADDLAALPEPRAGRLAVPSQPGLGIEPDPAALARLRVGPDWEVAA